MTPYGSRAVVDMVAEHLKIDTEPQRLIILSGLLNGARTVSEIDEPTGVGQPALGQPALSQRLAELRRTATMKTRQASKLTGYRLTDDTVTVYVRRIERMSGGKAAMNAPAAPLVGATAVGAAPRLKEAAAFARGA